MAPRSRARAAQQAAPAARFFKITQLPEAVLAKCLGFLDLKQRLGPASLACKRFAAAACSPELLRQMDVGELPNLPAVRSLAAFLARHGRHLQRLIVCCEDGTGEGEAIAAGAVTACLMTAGAGGQMAELTAIGCIRSSDWLAAMPSLRRLHLEARPLETDLHVSPEISSLTALSSLALEGDSIIPAGTRLPASLECVTLQWDCSDSFPEQVAHLPRLASLATCNCSFSADSLGALSRLSSSLTRLDVDCGTIPSSLAALMQLRDLRLWDCNPGGDDAVLSAALPHLRQLTRLVVLTEDDEVPAALAGLSSLQRCCLYIYAGNNVASPPLPAGPWLASLRWLRYNIDGLVSSTATLEAAAALEFLETGSSSLEINWRSTAAASFFDWLAQHPPLRRVYLDPAGRTFNSGLFAAQVARLCRRRPGLDLRFLNFDEVPHMLEVI